MDKELVRLVEERKAKEMEASKLKAANHNIQVKPIIETADPPPPPPPAAPAPLPSTTSTEAKMTLDEKVDDLLR